MDAPAPAKGILKKANSNLNLAKADGMSEVGLVPMMIVIFMRLWVINDHAIHDILKVGTISEVGYITNKLTQRLKARQFLLRIFSTKIFFSTKMEKFKTYF